jgi:hypothetical protein
MLSVFNNPVYKIAPADMVANWIAVEILRHINVDARPEILSAIKIWREDVYDIIMIDYKQHT